MGGYQQLGGHRRLLLRKRLHLVLRSHNARLCTDAVLLAFVALLLSRMSLNLGAVESELIEELYLRRRSRPHDEPTARR